MTKVETRGMLDAAKLLAASGKYQAALTLLAGLPPAENAIEVRLLRAKIFAQQARYDQAILEWQEVLSMAGDNEEAKRGVALARQMKDTKAGSAVLRAKLYYAVLAGVIALLAVSLCLVASRKSTSTAPAGGIPAAGTQAPGPATIDDVREASEKALAAREREILQALQGITLALDSLRAEGEAARRELASSREIQDKVLARHEAAIAALEDSINKIRDRVAASSETAAAGLRQVAGSLDDLRGKFSTQNERVCKALASLLLGLRPAKADKLTADIAKYRKQLDGLLALEAKLSARRRGLIDDIRLSRTRRQIALTRAVLADRQTQYDADVAPWDAAVKSLQGGDAANPAAPAGATDPYEVDAAKP